MEKDMSTDSLVVKGFCVNTGYVNNNYAMVNKYGEINTNALTYAIEKAIYTITDKSKISLITFKRKYESDNKVEVNIDPVVSNHILDVCEFLYNLATTTRHTETAEEIFDDLMNQFQGSMESLEIGTVGTDGRIYMPESLFWTFKGFTDPVVITIWFSNEAFLVQYDECEFKILPPLDNLDDFFLSPDIVKQKLSLRNDATQMELIRQLKQDNPETIITAEIYDFYNFYTNEVICPTSIHVVIYGIAGDDIDRKKEAICDYFLANSTHSRDDWVKVLPELFRRSEFTFIPRWDLYAIPDRTITAGVHSSLLTQSENLSQVRLLLENQRPIAYSNIHVNTHLQSFTHQYKYLGVNVIGSPENKNALYKFSQFAPDYIPASTTSNDFSRMSLETMQIATALSDLIILAETATKYSRLPKTISRVFRSNKMFLVKRVHYYNLIVYCKYNLSL